MFIDVPHPIHFACQYTVIVHYLLDLLPTTSKSAEFRTYIYIHNHNIKYLPQRKLPFSMINCTLRSKLSKLYLVRWFSHTCLCVHIYRLLFDIYILPQNTGNFGGFSSEPSTGLALPRPYTGTLLAPRTGGWGLLRFEQLGFGRTRHANSRGICTNHKTRWYKINDV